MFNYGNIYKQLDKCCKGFWTPKNVLTYNKPVIVITGSRSVGKSTGVAVLCLLDYIKNNHKFMYVRRRQTDTQKTCKTFFTNAIEIINRKSDFHISGFKYYCGKYYIQLDESENEEAEWHECGSATPLSMEEELKSSVFSDYFTIIYDEFISKNANKYLGTKANPDFEWDSVVSLYQTIDRGVDRPYRNETVIFLLGNKSTIYNPICLSLGIADYVNKGAHFTSPKNKIWIWEDVDKVEAVKEIEKSFAYQMSSESVKKYAYENEGSDTEYFIRKPKVYRYFITFKLKGEGYGVYIDKEQNFYIGYPRTDYSYISLDVDSHDGNDLHLVNNWRSDPFMKIVTEAYTKGRLYFFNGKIQSAILKYLEFTK